MMYRCFADLGVYPPCRVVKVDDTAPGIAEAVAAGAWAIGVTLSGNGCGLTETELAALRPTRATISAAASVAIRRRGRARDLDTVADLLPALAAIGARIPRRRDAARLARLARERRRRDLAIQSRIEPRGGVPVNFRAIAARRMSPIRLPEA